MIINYHCTLFKEMENMVDKGLAKSIGISNYNEKQITRIMDNARIQPSNLQVSIDFNLDIFQALVAMSIARLRLRPSTQGILLILVLAFFFCSNTSGLGLGLA